MPWNVKEQQNSLLRMNEYLKFGLKCYVKALFTQICYKRTIKYICTHLCEGMCSLLCHVRVDKYYFFSNISEDVSSYLK